ncbi:MAG: BrnT family toxin [Erysipelotrichaceae bacterium]|nr:BrnT family toxin [Erysipelotrichaceae bacterium]
MIKFTWDEKKNQSNIKKHGISFDEAVTVFLDENAILVYDEPHSEAEDRFILLGISNKSNMLVVCHCYRDKEETIRIISARKADKGEIKDYYERGGQA